MRRRITRSVEQNAPFNTHGQLLGARAQPSPSAPWDFAFVLQSKSTGEGIKGVSTAGKKPVCGGRHRRRVEIPTAGDGIPRAASIRSPGTLLTQRGNGERAKAGASSHWPHCPPCHVLPGHPLNLQAPAFGIKPRKLFFCF